MSPPIISGCFDLANLWARSTILSDLIPVNLEIFSGAKSARSFELIFFAKSEFTNFSEIKT